MPPVLAFSQIDGGWVSARLHGGNNRFGMMFMPIALSRHDEEVPYGPCSARRPF